MPRVCLHHIKICDLSMPRRAGLQRPRARANARSPTASPAARIAADFFGLLTGAAAPRSRELRHQTVAEMDKSRECRGVCPGRRAERRKKCGGGQRACHMCELPPARPSWRAARAARQALWAVGSARFQGAARLASPCPDPPAALQAQHTCWYRSAGESVCARQARVSSCQTAPTPATAHERHAVSERFRGRRAGRMHRARAHRGLRALPPSTIPAGN